MKKYVFAAAVSALLIGLSAQAAPVSTSTSGLQGQVTGEAVKVWHCRAFSGGWGCGGGHRRYWSHRRHGSHY
jgi:Spy/CpxP family protein refolding chaperone